MAAFTSTTKAGAQWAGNLDPPADVDAQPGCEQDTAHVDLSWPALDNADGYEIHRRVDSDGD